MNDLQPKTYSVGKDESMSHAPFSVLMSVYKNDNPQWLRKAIESITFRQSIMPSEVILVIDGPIPTSLQNEINALNKDLPLLKVKPLAENKGLGLALQYGMTLVENELVARMDSDDISLPNRFELQLKAFEDNPKLSIVGCQISEFIDLEDNIVGYRKVPCKHEEIKSFLKTRDAFNHMSVMFRKSEILRIGNYQHWYLNEDSYLWLRMLLGGCKFANLPDIGVNVRVGKDMYARRGGWKYFKSELGLQNLRLKKGVISPFRYIFNVSLHFGVKVIMTNKLRGWLFKNILREKN